MIDDNDTNQSSNTAAIATEKTAIEITDNMRTKRLEIRLTEDEKKTLEIRAKEARISVSNYLRRSALIEDNTTQHTHTNTSNRVELDVAIKELIKTNMQLAPALNNLNQIARFANADKRLKPELASDLNKLIEEVYGTVQLLANTIRKLS